MTPTAAYEHVPGLQGLQAFTRVLPSSDNGVLGLRRWKSRDDKIAVEGGASCASWPLGISATEVKNLNMLLPRKLHCIFKVRK